MSPIASFDGLHDVTSHKIVKYSSKIKNIANPQECRGKYEIMDKAHCIFSFSIRSKLIICLYLAVFTLRYLLDKGFRRSQMCPINGDEEKLYKACTLQSKISHVQIIIINNT
jgi:hypothetical protein